MSITEKEKHLLCNMLCEADMCCCPCVLGFELKCKKQKFKDKLKYLYNYYETKKISKNEESNQ